MSNARKLSGSGSNWSQPKIFPLGTGSSDSSSALTVENVKRLEKEYKTSKESFNKQRIEDYIKQTDLARFSKETTRKISTEIVQDAEPEGASSSFPIKQSKNSKEFCRKTSEEISRKDKLITAPATDSPSAQPTGSKPKESKQCVDGCPASRHSRRHNMEDEMTQTEWSYSDESLSSREDAVSVVGEEEKSSEAVGGRSSFKATEDQATEMLSRYTEVHPEPGENKEEVTAEDGEENNQAGLCEQATGESVELSQGSPRPESDEEPLSTGGRHEDDETATDLCPDEETTCMEDSAKCTFCNTPDKPIPTLVDLKKQPHKNLFCCRRYKEEFETVIEELMKEDEVEKELMNEDEVEKELMNEDEVKEELMNKDEVKEELDITPHADFSQAELRSNIKEKLLQHLNEGGFENYREILRLYLKFVTGNSISFRLSKQEEGTVRPETAPFKKHRPASASPEDLLELDSDFVVEHLKHCCSSEPVRRCYPDGQMFFLLFPDGSGQVYYPSGNVAILIVFSEETLFTYYILEDSKYPGIRAVFGSHGHGVCSYPDGHLWTVLNPCTGICLDQTGTSQKHWRWHDFSHHTHSPPFQSITMKVNDHITIRILAQDQIDLSFANQSNCIRFNVGSWLKLKDPETSHLLKWPESKEELFLQSKKLQLRNLLSEIQRVLKYFWQPLSQ
ncbi:glutamate-rich protein 6B [Caloenas nicobarica]|uniref:glutamate-rich protein 6B n=1 Tax=Caloenas nicobarica TaxID=187106 RepID=UPI0032B7A8D2